MELSGQLHVPTALPPGSLEFPWKHGATEDHLSLTQFKESLIFK
jgi:hypothetical protein